MTESNEQECTLCRHQVLCHAQVSLDIGRLNDVKKKLINFDWHGAVDKLEHAIQSLQNRNRRIVGRE